MLYFISAINHESSIAITTSFITFVFFECTSGQQFIVRIVFNQQDYFLGHTMLYYFDILGFNFLSSPFLRSLADLRSGICLSYENWRRSNPKCSFPLALINEAITSFSSEFIDPKVLIIFRFVSILHGRPCSIRVMVLGDRSVFLASSTLLIIRDSLISFREFLLISLTLERFGFMVHSFTEIFKVFCRKLLRISL